MLIKKPEITKQDVQKILDDPCVRYFREDIIKRGMTHDPVSAVKDVKLALLALETYLS